MYQAKEISGTKVGMGLSGISSVHLFEKGFNHDRNYFIRMSGQQMIIYRGIVKKPKRQKIHENSLANLKQSDKGQGISANVKRKILKYIDAWFTTVDYAKTSGVEETLHIKKHLSLLTLTLPVKQMHDDKHIKRYGLMMFIKALKRKHPSVNYLWKAESQKNGNIHFHIILDEFIHKSTTDRIWHGIMLNLGYVQAYKRSTGKDNPPMCNVETLRDKNSAGAYVAKYFSKNADDRPIEGRLWGCSDQIKQLANPELSVDEKGLNECFNKINTNLASAYITDYCVILKNVQDIENLFVYGLSNYTYYNTLIKNVHALYSVQYTAFASEPETDWEKDVIKEVGHINALYLFENEMIGY